MRYQPNLRRSVVCILAVLAAGAVAMPVMAGDGPVEPAGQSTQTNNSAASGQANPQKAQNLPTITVTGSHIPRVDLVTSQPTLHISHQEIENSGFKTIGQFLDGMTSVGFVQGPAEGSFYGDGSEQVDLRYLGSNRLLVLLNGKRMPSSFGGSVDLNQIPISIVQRIDVLQDGASAVYGADAIAGVINIITKKHFNGAQVSVYSGISNGPKTGDWDGQTQHIDLTLGHSGDKGHILFDVSYLRANAIPALDREFSTSPAVFKHSRGDIASPEGTFIFWAPTNGDPTKPGNVPIPQTGLTSAQCPDSLTPNGYYIPLCFLAKTPMTSGTSAADFHKYNAVNDGYTAGSQSIPITLNQKIKNVYTEGSYDITPSITFTASALYNDRQTRRPLDSDLMFFENPGLDIGVGQFGNPFNIPLDIGKPVKVGETPSGQPVILQGGNLGGIFRTTNEAGIRVGFDNVTTERFAAGLKGQFSIGSKYWHWDVDYIYGSNKVTSGETNIDSPLGMSLATDQSCYNVPGCAPLDLFGGQGANGTGTWTPAMIQYTMQKKQIFGIDKKDERIVDANIASGDIFDLPGGPVGVAFGAQRRVISGSTKIPGLQAPSRNNPTPAQPLSGTYSIDSAYAELNIPLLSNVPGAKALSTDLASRFEHYSTFGNTVRSRFGLLYQPIKDLLFRVSWSQGFRAADLSELFTPATVGYPYVTDPCSSYTAPGVPAKTVANCKAAGIPPGYTQTTGQVTGISSGNINLKPETSTSKTFGVVYSPSQLPGLNISLDYYHIALTNEISAFGAQQILNYCYKDGLPQFCGLVTRFSSTGAIDQVHITDANIGATRTAGVDMDASYQFPETSLGQFKLKFNVTKEKYYNEYNPRPDGTVSVTRVVGNLDYGAIPRLKAYAALDYRFNRFSAALIGHYFSGFTGTCSDSQNGTPLSLANLGFCSNPNTQNNALSSNHRDALSWFDLHLSYHTHWKTTFSLGVNNIFGQTPKGGSDGYGNVASLDYGVYSRFVYAQIQTKF